MKWFCIVMIGVLLAGLPSSGLYSQADDELDGMIAFSSDREGFFEYKTWEVRKGDIYVMNADGSNVIKLTGTPPGVEDWLDENEPAWSPNGRKIAFGLWDEPSNSGDLYTMNADGGRARAVTGSPFDDEYNHSQPNWSPDGRQIVFTDLSWGGIGIIEADGGPARSSWPDIDVDASDPDWSPDGKRIVFQGIQYTANGDQTDLYLMSKNATSIQRLTNTPFVEGSPSWSPDGRKIAFISDQSGDFEIYVMNSNGSNVTRLTYSAGNDTEPTWSPTGEKIAFTSYRDGNSEIYVMDSNGGDQINLTNNPSVDRQPDWTAATSLESGRTIYVTPRTPGTVGNLKFADEDIIVYDEALDRWFTFFDGSDVGLSANDIDAFAFTNNGGILMSFVKPQKLPWLDVIDDSDIVYFDPYYLGSYTDGYFSLYMDGTDVRLTYSYEDIDAIGLTADGRPVISTIGRATVPGATAEDEDLLVCNDFVFGADSACNWSLYFDGSDVNLLAAQEDITGVQLDYANGQIYLTSKDGFDVGGFKGLATDIFVCDPVSLGNSTTCNFSLFWSGKEAGLSPRFGIEGFDLGNPPLMSYSLNVTMAANIDEEIDVDDVDDEGEGLIFMPSVMR